MLAKNTVLTIGLLVFSAIMYFLIIPNHIEKPMFDDDWTNPSSMPIIHVAGIAFFAVWQMVVKHHEMPVDTPVFIKSIAFIGVAIVCVYIMFFVSFVVVAPIMVLGMMLAVGERKPTRLVLGVLLTILLWYLVTVELGRALP